MSKPQIFKDYPYDPPVIATWVVGSYEGERAKSVMAHAAAGVGYIILERSGNRLHPACLAAFRMVPDGPLPHHLTEVKDPAKIREYEKKMGRS